jgi:hypothetical protein
MKPTVAGQLKGIRAAICGLMVARRDAQQLRPLVAHERGRKDARDLDLSMFR